MQERRRRVNPLPVDDNVAKARMFHLAQGVLVGLRRAASRTGLNELIDVAQSRTVTICADPRCRAPPPAAGRSIHDAVKARAMMLDHRDFLRGLEDGRADMSSRRHGCVF